MGKVCSKCKIEKDFFNFDKRKNAKDGHRADCKLCRKKVSDIWRNKNKDRVKENNKNWRENNPEKSQEIYAKYRKTDKRKEAANKWARNNREAGLKRFVEKYNSDPQFNIAIKFRRRIYMAVRNQYTEKAKSTIDLLGCSYLELKEYLENKFTQNMSWEKVLSGEIHLDHILPCASFDLTDEQQQKECFNYKNLQPLWAKDNLSKGCKILPPVETYGQNIS